MLVTRPVKRAPIGYFAAPALLEFVNATPAVQAEALPFLRIMFVYGVGMMLAKSIVELHDGSIVIANREGGGGVRATLMFHAARLPAAEPASPSDKPEEQVAVAQRR